MHLKILLLTFAFLALATVSFSQESLKQSGSSATLSGFVKDEKNQAIEFAIAILYCRYKDFDNSISAVSDINLKNFEVFVNFRYGYS